MAKNELNNQSAEELRMQLAAERTKLAQLRQELVGKKLSNTAQIREVRKQIARILTALNKAV